MNKVLKCLKKSAGWAFGISSAIFMFVPEAFYKKTILPTRLLDFLTALPMFKPEDVSNTEELANISSLINIVANRILLLIAAFFFAMVVVALWSKAKRRVSIEGMNYRIVVKYGDIFKMRKSQKVINFDECFTTKVGVAPGQIKPGSVCGQYLLLYPLAKHEIQDLISRANLKPLKSKSSFQCQDRYESGVLIPRDDFLLMAFAKLDSDGLGKMTWDEYLSCLRLLWKEIDKYYAEKDVCVPVLGSGITRMNNEALTQQELVDAMIASYKLSAKKINSARRLIIACIRNDGFSLDKIG